MYSEFLLSSALSVIHMYFICCNSYVLLPPNELNFVVISMLLNMFLFVLPTVKKNVIMSWILCASVEKDYLLPSSLTEFVKSPFLWDSCWVSLLLVYTPSI